MTFEKAKQEFEIRYYLWATSEWQKEIDESFPNLCSFKSGPIWKTHQFMRLLKKNEQMTLAHGLLKRFHPDAVKILGESCSPEEETLRRKRDGFFDIRQKYQFVQQLTNGGQLDVAEFWLQQLRGDAVNVPGISFFSNDESLLSQLNGVFQMIGSTLDEQIAARRKAGEKIKFISKRKLLKRVAEKFQEAFGNQCNEAYRVLEGDPSLAFETKCCGWILTTHFWFGRSASLINYSHSIASEKDFEQQGSNGTYMAPLVIASGISLSAWLGITSQIELEYLMDEDVDPSCDAVIKYCHHFVEVLPKFLKGLEFEKITSE